MIFGQLVILIGLTSCGIIAGIIIGLPLPLPLLTGPAIVTSVASLAGLSLRFPTWLRDAVFLIAGVAIGATVSPASVAALLKWPLAFAALVAALFVMMFLGQRLMQCLMQTDARSALLAATPGHLSYVIAFGEEIGLATHMVAVVQSVRLLALTLLIPFAAQFAGIHRDRPV